MKLFTTYIIVLFIICLSVIPIQASASTTECRNSYLQEVSNVDKEWIENSLSKIKQQTLPTKNLVPISIHDFRSYACKLENICLGVEASIINSTNTNLESIYCSKSEVPTFESCSSQDNESALLEIKNCNEAIDKKIEMGKVFMRSVLHTDAYHKKTAALVEKYHYINLQLHDDLSENMRKMVGYFTEFVKRTNCYLFQCTVL